jgi:hypothetical protein
VDKTSRAGFNSGVEKSLKMAQNPTRQVHALLGAGLLEASPLNYIIVSMLIAQLNVSFFFEPF